MIDIHRTVARKVCRRRLLAACLFAVVVAGFAAPVAATAADTPTRSVQDAANDSLSFTYRGDAVAHEGEILFVWRREQLDVLVRGARDRGGERVCLYRSGLANDSSQSHCRRIEPGTTTTPITFEDVGYSTGGPMVYRIEARVHDESGQVVASADSRRIVQITNWSALNGSQFASYFSSIGLPNGSEAAENGSGGADRRGAIGGQESASEAVPAPGLPDVPMGSFGLVVLLGSGGVLALLGLLVVQRRRGTESDQPGPIVVESAGESPTDTERIVRLLAENGGQLKQSEIVERTDWSKAKVSRLLSRMSDRGHIEKHQDGRQNIIVLRR
ncbi:MarR family transcriptional regulator [Halorientalis sp. IM1011]|uniref:helix-turn-helix transcriptional regulator n=1 Tax=Halorientalis sp. IM1011 TaxID=1932360 RepID=UPI0009FBDC5D|nr:MarR family transcriptional regulator [Halorientalis sp. IM1011]